MLETYKKLCRLFGEIGKKVFFFPNKSASSAGRKFPFGKVVEFFD
jgi:hypothetical protein